MEENELKGQNRLIYALAKSYEHGQRAVTPTEEDDREDDSLLDESVLKPASE